MIQVKNYYQRRLDSGQKDFEQILSIAEEKKARGEATGPLPVPSVAPKRRYEATPSAIVPRPLAPHGELMAEADETRFPPKGKPLAMSPQPISMHGRPLPENERSASRYPTLAQASASTAAPPIATTLGDDASRTMRGQGGPPSRMPGPRLGYFTEDRRDSTLQPHSSARAQDISHHGPGAPLPTDLARMDPMAQPGYMSTQTPGLLSSTHSRHPSLTQPPGSPTQLPRPDLEIASTHRDPFGQRQFYPLPSQSVGISQSPRPILSPVKDIPRGSVTPAPEAPRQVPAKRSNIMSILNDEPEDPQPRKRFASEVPSAPVSSSTSASRSAYQQTGSTRPEEVTKPTGYGQHGQYPSAPSRGYAEYPSYGPAPGGSATPANNDWMARFDPRAQQAGPPAQAQPPPQPSGRTAGAAAQNSFAHFGSASSQPSGSLNSLSAPSPVPTPPPAASQRSAYSNIFAQPPAGQSAAPGSRDMPSQHSSYRSGSPPPRASSVAFGSRQEAPTPAQSSPGLFGMPPRQTGSQSAYGPGAPSTPAAAQPHSQSYQQHVQTLVSGSHRSTPVNMPGGAPQYGHSTPPPQAQGGRSMPSLATLGRSYTPPSALHPSVGGGGMGYAPPPPPSSGPMPPLHQRPSGSGSLGEPASTPTHHRVYSQGSTQGGQPGPLHPPSQPPR